MVCEIMKDVMFLSLKSEQAGFEDMETAKNLLETLIAHQDECVGMAANMIGVNKRIIAFNDNDSYKLMFNPIIVKKSGAFQAEEGCLSLEGKRPVKRWKTIKVQYQTEDLKTRFKTYSGWTAQIIQHEIDHCDGIII